MTHVHHTVLFLALVLIIPSGTSEAQSSDYQIWAFDNTEIWNDHIFSEIKQLLDFNSSRNGSTLTIPVVFHVVLTDRHEWISDEMILRQLNFLNQDFQGSNPDRRNVPDRFKKLAGRSSIQFCIATHDPQRQPALPIIRVHTWIPQIGIKKELYSTAKGGSDAWDTDRYLNIWIADTGDDIAGLGSAPGQRNKYEDGVVIHPEIFNSDSPCRTLTPQTFNILKTTRI